MMVPISMDVIRERGEAEAANSEKMYYALVMLVRGRAQLVLRGVPEGNGYEAWRVLNVSFDQQDTQSVMGLLQAVLGFPAVRDLESLRDKLAELELLMQRYESLAGRELADEVKRAVLSKIVPEPLKSHLQVNAASIASFEKMRETVCEYVLAKTAWKLTSLIPDTSGPMEVDEVRGRGKGKGKDGGKKGSGRGAWSQGGGYYTGQGGGWPKGGPAGEPSWSWQSKGSKGGAKA